MFNWDGDLYSKFEKERSLPAIDLVNSIDIERVDKIIDIGCGIGNSTVILAKRFPNAKIVGVDNSQEMLDKAKNDYPNIEFVQLDISNELSKISDKFDIVFSNACIQWVPNHKELLPQLFNLLKEGGVLAIQTPLQDIHPVHIILQNLAKSDKWKKKLGESRIFYNLKICEYFDILSEISNNFRMWETIYMHSMPSYESIIEWYKGTGLRPYLNRLCDAEQDEFLKDVKDALKDTYSIQKKGNINFEFPRLLFVVKK